ncbi:DUF1707 domain-containing protein [Actinopolymorpha pittospori]|uniref:Cell wall-active antibiotics response 4TMS YvqF n=1 Tax=Actinopolymorpha pittospori TaxID=648752 RepID=A0A927RBF7_9ACTN|nr:hypothetical protein [Actinopolymorpha pittospori]
MSQLPEPTDASHVRASDADRQRIAEVLRDAAGEGRLTLEELDERLDGVFAAKTYADLERFTSDLPADFAASAALARTAPTPKAVASNDRVTGGTARHAFSVAVLSGATRRGAWLVPPAYTTVAFMGGVQIDLRSARFTQREVTIRAFAVMGGIEIIVPEDVAVVVDGVGIMGGFDDHSYHVEPVPGQLTVRVTGLAFWGGVEVKRKGNGSKGSKPEIEK